MDTDKGKTPRKPPWLKVRIGQGEAYTHLQGLLKSQRLHTVCEEALCPNRGECWQHGRATLMILGDVCTRNCGFCNVASARPGTADPEEPARVAEAVTAMGLREVVVTSVTRDDLPDGGAGIWAKTIRRIQEAVPGIRVEVLIPDFTGSVKALNLVLAAKPDVVGHNLETVPSLYPRVRPQADYRRSLQLLRRAHRRGFIVKTGIMVGFGESQDEILALMRDAVKAGCDIFTLGQYLQPSRKHLPVARYGEPVEFDRLRDEGLAMGFKVVISAPLVRSSYHSEVQTEFVNRVLGGGRGGC